MKTILYPFLASFALLFCGYLPALAQLNTAYLGHFDYGDASCSNLWGYAADNREYAIVGTSAGTSVVEVTDAANPVQRGFIPGGETAWREIKTFGHYAYVVEEQVPEGLVIIDLSQLPDTVTAINWYGDNTASFNTGHTLFIDEADSMLYIFGSDYGVGGAIIASLANNPQSPEIKGIYNNYYIHDGYVRNDTLWAAEINDGQLEVLNVADPSNITAMGSVVTPSAFTHNCWLTDDGKTIFTTDEVSNAYITAYDVSDVSDIKELDRVQSNPGSQNIPHNTYVVNTDYIVTSCYTDGITIHDISNPSNMVQIGYYDSSPMSGNGFNGAWGVYPFLPSGKILISDIEEGLFVVSATYMPAARLRGVVTDADTGAPIQGVSVSIEGGSMVATATGFTGDYATGTATGGTYIIHINKVGYNPVTITDQVLTSGSETVVNAALQALPSFTLQGRVVDTAGNGIAQAMVAVNSESISYDANTDADGYFSIPTFLSGTYSLYAGKWGYLTAALQNNDIPFGTTGILLTLEQGYQDDFVFDYGWATAGTTELGGEWQLGEPIGTTFSPFPGTFNPDFDVADDLGDQCYSTGNSGDFFDMVDGGTVTLTSPLLDLSTYDNAYLSYSLWFLNLSQAGFGTNDSVRVLLTDSEGSVVLQVLHSNDSEFLGAWQPYTFRLNDYLSPPFSPMSLRIEATADYNQTQLLEVAFDAFSVIDSADIVDIRPISSPENALHVAIYPNPATDQALLVLSNYDAATPAQPLTLHLFDSIGRQVQQYSITQGSSALAIKQLSNGIYFYSLCTGQGEVVAKDSLAVQR